MGGRNVLANGIPFRIEQGISVSLLEAEEDVHHFYLPISFDSPFGVEEEGGSEGHESETAVSHESRRFRGSQIRLWDVNRMRGAG